MELPKPSIKTIDRFFESPILPLITVIGLSCFFGFFKLGQTPLMEWDESYHGELALQMLENKNWFNYYYAGQPELWFAKPPLAIWAIVGSFSIFGTTEFALRLPSALAIVISFYFIYQFIQQTTNRRFAFFCCLMLVSINGLIGPHVGRSGDTDAMLVCFLMGANLHFWRLLMLNKRRSAIWCGLFLVLAFWTKGPAALELAPGWILFLILSKRLVQAIKKLSSWIPFLCLILGAGIWLVAVLEYGNQFNTAKIAGSNSAEALIFHDFIDRFFRQGVGQQKSWSFVLTTLDSKFSIWLYLGLFGSILLFFIRNTRSRFLPLSDVQLLSLLTWTSLCIFLTFGNTQYSWYLAPVLPFIGINTWGVVSEVLTKITSFWIPVAAVFIITLSIKVAYLGNPVRPAHVLADHTEDLRNVNRVVFYGREPLDQFLFAHLRNPNCIIDKKAFQNPESGLYVMGLDTFLESNFEELTELARSRKSVLLIVQ